MKLSHYNNIGIALLSLCFLGCTKFVAVNPPTTELVTASVFNNSATATSAQLAIYSKMYANNESPNLAIQTGFLGDELTNYNTSSSYVQLYTNSMTASQVPGPWVDAYNYIYQANAIISALQNSQSISSQIQQQLLGESKFVRAFWFFYLTNLYGDIPLVTSTNYSVNDTIVPTSKAQVYSQIIIDLKDAQNLLSSNYVDASDTAITKDRTRPTKWAATALLARVYLYIKDYVDAEAQASAVINNTALYGLCSNLNNVFLANSSEAIWQLGIPLPSSYNTMDGYDFILISAPSVCSVAPQLLNSFEAGDSRRVNWVDSFKTTTAPIKNYYYPYKYKVRSSSTITEYVMVLRLAEQYLIRAEARLLQGNAGGSVIDLNTIRLRANLQAYSGGNDQQSLLTAILHERQVELFTEWGNRWLDLSRTGSIDSVMSIVAPSKGGTWNADGHQALYPIPQSEISLDVNLTQNPGY